MTKEEFRQNALEMLYLSQCIINGNIPDKARAEALNLEQLYKTAKRHSMTAITAMALESVGIKDEKFTIAKEKAFRKNILMDAERRKILQKLEESAIWYMPLKGAVLKDYYPKMGMREMSDNDILFDAQHRQEVHDIMLAFGFEADHFGVGYDDAYFKKPVFNFEMHSELFSVTDTPLSQKFHEYYADIHSRLLKDEENQYGLHFSPEDFYLYMTAHEYKHYVQGGTGVRSLLDIYIFMQKFHDTLNWNYLNAELETLGISDYEHQSREIAMKFFWSQELSPQQMQILDYYIFSGTYGTASNDAANRMKNFEQKSENTSSFRYVFQRIFPPMEIVKTWYPFFYKYKIFLPVLWFIVRPFKALTVKRGIARAEYHQLKNKSDSEKNT